MAIGTALIAGGGLRRTGARARRHRARAPRRVTTRRGPYLGIGVQGHYDSETRQEAQPEGSPRRRNHAASMRTAPPRKPASKKATSCSSTTASRSKAASSCRAWSAKRPSAARSRSASGATAPCRTLTATIEASKGRQMYHRRRRARLRDARDARSPTSERPHAEFENLPDFADGVYHSPMLGIIGEPLGQQEQLAEFFGVKEGVLVKSVDQELGRGEGRHQGRRRDRQSRGHRGQRLRRHHQRPARRARPRRPSP